MGACVHESGCCFISGWVGGRISTGRSRKGADADRVDASGCGKGSAASPRVWGHKGGGRVDDNL
jgi:hypothetical protein